MARSDNWIGLNARATAFVKGGFVVVGKETITREFDNGRKETVVKDIKENTVKREQYSSHDGAFDLYPFPLFKYIFPNGMVYFEEVQEAPWASGPHFFTALKDDNGSWIKESLWTDKEMGEILGTELGTEYNEDDGSNECDDGTGDC